MSGTVDQIDYLGITIPWPLQEYMELPAVPAAVASARHHARRTLAEWELDGEAGDVELIVSELVTNAIRATIASGRAHGTAGTRPPVRLWLSSDGRRVVIQIWDCASAMPRLRDAQPEATGGRGLVLVDSLSEGWGSYRPRRASGKVVYAIVGPPGQS